MHLLSLKLEGLGELVVELENWINSQFLSAIISDLSAETGFDYNTSDLKYWLGRADIGFRHEVMCLPKVIGHPLVSMEKGSRSSQEGHQTVLC